MFEHAVRMPSVLAHFWTSSGRQRRNTACPAQLEQLPYIYESAPLLHYQLNSTFIMPITKSTKTQRASGATDPTKDKSKPTKTTKVFTAIDTSRLTPDQREQREMRRHRRTTERECAARAHNVSDDCNDIDDSPAAAETTLVVTQQAPLDVSQGTPPHPDGDAGTPNEFQGPKPRNPEALPGSLSRREGSMDLGGGEDINTERDVTSVRMIPSLMNRGPPDDEDHDGESSPEDVEVQEDGNIGDKPKSDPEDNAGLDRKISSTGTPTTLETGPLSNRLLRATGLRRSTTNYCCVRGP